jgi:hypothetical protein
VATKVESTMHNYTTHLIDRQHIIYVGIILNSCHIYIYLACHNAILYPAFAILKGNDIGIVVVTQKVAIHLAMILRRAENIVNLASGISLLTDDLLNPTS